MEVSVIARMLNASKSAYLFLKEHKLVTLVLILSLSLLFITSSFLHGMSRRNEIDVIKYEPYANSSYSFAFSPASKEDVSGLLTSIDNLNADIFDCVIRGYGVLVNPGTDVKQNVDITGYYRKIQMPSSIIRGSDKIGIDEVLINAWTFSDIFGPRDSGCLYDVENSDQVIFNTAGEKQIAGVVYYATPMSFWGIIVDSNQFFEIAEECTSLEIAFLQPLSETEEREFLESVSKNVTLVSAQYPEDIWRSSSSEGEIQLVLYRLIIAIAILFTFKLILHLFHLRKSEFAILRLLGARRITLYLHIFCTLLPIIVSSTIVGVIILSILTRSFEYIFVFKYMTVFQVLSDIAFFWGITFAISIFELILSDRFLVESATEGV